MATVGLGQPSSLKATFQYNYYVPEESATENNGRYRSSREGVPRRVDVSFTAPAIAGIITGNGEDYNDMLTNLDKIHSAEDIPNMSNTYVTVQDTGLLGRATDSIERSCRIRGISGNPTDRALNLSYSVSGSVDTNVLQRLSVNYSSLNMTFYTEGREIDSKKYTFAKGMPVTALVYDKVVADLCNNAEASSPNSSPVALGLIGKYLSARQNKERSSAPSISSDDFTSILAPISYVEKIEAGTTPASPAVTRVGYIVERVEELSSGKREKRIVGALQPTQTSFVDYNVKYGSRYSYTVRAVYSLNVPEILMKRYDSVTSKVLISSTPSNISTVTTEEKIPPKPPRNVSFTFDHTRDVLNVMWEEPIDLTRDITRYQVFRRKKLSEPFTLLKEFDFDKSVVTYERLETPLRVNVTKSDYPVKRYADYDFGRSSTYIYCVCSVDAHGFVSNYSAQYQVTFNKRLNSIEVKCVSPSGAPRPYPNLYVNIPGSLTLDTITRSGVSAVNVHFDPEYLSLLDRSGNDLKLLKYDDSGSKYYMSLIDTTRAEQVYVPITIKDLRSK
jgi:hypothetical protein